MLGFGGADKPDLDYGIELWRKQSGEPTVFAGNSIGGVLTPTLMADAPDMVASGAIVNRAGGG